MVLKSEIEGYRVEYTTGDKIGKVKDIIADITQERWPVKGLHISKGIGQDDIVLIPSKEVELDIHKEEVVVTHNATFEKPIVDASNLKNMHLEFMDDLKVLSKDEEEIGKVYNVVLHTSSTPWRVWKILVKTRGIKARRLRLDIRDIEKVTDEAILLKLNKSEIEEIEKEEE